MLLCKWRLLHSLLSNRFIQFRSSRLLHDFSSHHPTRKSTETRKESGNPADFGAARIVLSPRVVGLTLLNCPSDVIALSFFMWCAKQPNYFHDTGAFDHMVGVLAHLTEQFQTVQGVVRELERIGCVAKAHVFLLLLRIYWKGGMYGLVFETYEQMGKHGFVPNTFACNVTIDVLFRIGCVDKALLALRQMQVPNFLTFNISVCNLCKLNDLVNIRPVLRIMLMQRFYPNAGTFQMVVKCFVKMGRIEEAYQVLALMITLGISTSVNVWSMLVDGECRSGRVDMACYLLKKMVKTGCSPNVVTYTPLIKVLLESQMIDGALNILNFMLSNGYAPDLILYNVLIDGLSKIGRYDDALDVYGNFSKQNLQPDSYTFCTLLSTICLSRRFSLLPELVSGIAVEADLVIYNSLLSYFCKAGYPDLVVELYSDIVDSGFIPDKFTYTGLVRGLCGARRISDAINVYRGIVMNHSGLDAHIHTVIIDGLIKAGKNHTAIGLFREAVLKGYPLDVVSYTVAIQGLFGGDRTGEACTLYKQMKEAGILPNAQTYNLLLSGFCKEGDVEMITQILQEMIDAKIKLSRNNFFRINRCSYESSQAHLLFYQLDEMMILGLIPTTTTSEKLFDHDQDEEQILSSKGYIDISDSQGLFVVAASVG